VITMGQLKLHQNAAPARIRNKGTDRKSQREVLRSMTEALAAMCSGSSPVR
jgi:hypothetical protein